MGVDAMHARSNPVPSAAASPEILPGGEMIAQIFERKRDFTMKRNTDCISD
jgi:hypothetical protein